MKRGLRYLILVLLIGAGNVAFAQSSGIQGTVTGGDGKIVINAGVEVRQTDATGAVKGGVVTNYDGEYVVSPLEPGVYAVIISYNGNRETVTNVRVNNGVLTTVNAKIGTSKEIPEVHIRAFKIPLVDPKRPGSSNTKTADQIIKLPVQNINAIASLTPGVYQGNNRGGLNIGGGRSSGTKYIVDGVQIPPGEGIANLPPSAIEEIETITGGVSAKYGDASGGIVNVTTKGATAKTTGSINLEQSLDVYNNKYAYFHLSGPLLKRFDSATKTRVPILGYELHGSFSYNHDATPYYTPTYILKPGVLADLQSNPFTLLADATGQVRPIDRASLITADELTTQKQKVNDRSYGPQLGGKLDYQLSSNVSVLAGGQYNYSNGKNFSRYSTIFAPDMNSVSTGNTERAFLRFTQHFGNGKADTGIISHAYYTVQADYNRNESNNFDDNLKQNTFLYGYKGKFIQNYASLSTSGLDSVSGTTLIKTFDVPIGYTFVPSSVNPVSANYTQSYLNLMHTLYGSTAPTNIIGLTDNQFLNGGFANGINGLLTNITGGNTGYSKGVSETYSVTADASFNLNTRSGIKNQIEFGLYFQQQNQSSYSVAASGLWSLMRQLEDKVVNSSTVSNEGTYVVNGHVYTQDEIAHHVVTPGPLDTVYYDHAFNAAGQQQFDKNLRQKLFGDPNNHSIINVDALDPSTFSLDMFSADELLNGGKPLVSYFGYDYTGKKLSGQVNFDDFFTKKDANGNFTRPIGAIRPNYIAGYLQDYIQFKDFNMTVGVRAERYDANTKVLKDPYSLYAERTVGSVPGAANTNNGGVHPDNIGSNYVVYVDNQTSPTIIGYRNGDTWYDPKGRVVEDPATLKQYIINGSSDPQAYKQNADDNIRTEGYQSSSSFTDYKPAVTVMPRVNFSFPIVKDKSFFYAHYDIIVQRPTTGYAATPLNYYYLDQSGSINNPDLKPEKNIDYEVGFQQALTQSTAITLGAYHHERKDQIQLRAYLYANPTTYYTYGNRDYSSTEGFKFTYDFRRDPKSHLEMQVNYTLSFVTGTGSNESSASGQLQSFIAAGLPNLRNVYALDYDSRHSINVSADYRYAGGEGPSVGGHHILANAGINLTFRARSGEPYTRYLFPQSLGGITSNSNTIDGSINDSRLPWHFGLDLRIDKEFTLGAKKAKTVLGSRTGGLHMNAYLRVENVLNIQDILSVYKYTGSAKDDGFLSSEVGQNYISTSVLPVSAQAFSDLYYILMQEPGQFNVPRRITLGLSMSF